MSPKTAIRNTPPAAAPVLKWAGGKTRLLAQYDRHFPKDYAGYYEPFVGSAAVFFHLQKRRRPRPARLGDVNQELINFYQVLRDAPDDLIEKLSLHRELHCKDYYYDVRALEVADLDSTERAARLMYLNKTCYNGLYRVNASGRFNVPMGSYKQPAILDEARLRAASAALQGVELEVEPFESVLQLAKAGDLVYFDPPYQPLSSTSYFTSYTAGSFGESDQQRLAQVFTELADSGVKVLLSNSATPLVEQLYKGFRIIRVKANRAINSKANRRHKITELLITSKRR